MTDSAVMPVLSINVASPQHPDVTAGGVPTTPSLLFAMVPIEVRRDPRLTHRDKVVYMELAGARRGSRANIGERLLAGHCGIDRRGLRKVIRKLVDCGHVELEECAGRKRARYLLTSRLFAPAVAAIEETPVRPVSVPAAQSCGKCARRVRGLGKTGVCRNCAVVERTEKIADRVARRVVKEEIVKVSHSRRDTS